MSQGEGIAIETELRGWLKKACAERDRLAERVKELELENSAYRGALPAANNIADEALVQVAMLREALQYQSQREGHVGKTTECAMCGAWWLDEDLRADRLPEHKDTCILAATADAGKWLEQHDDAVRRDEREIMGALTGQYVAEVIRARGKK